MGSEPDCRWCRASLSDLAVVVAAFAVAAWAVTRNFSIGLHRPHPVEQVLGCVVIGAALAGPLILASQWLFRRRRVALSTGEWLWVTPMILYLSVMASTAAPSPISRVFDSPISLILGWVGTQCYVSTFAFVRTLWRLFRPGTAIACRWTDLAGGVTCSLAAPLVTYEVGVGLNQL